MQTQDGITPDVSKAERAGLFPLFLPSLPMSSMTAYTDTLMIWYFVLDCYPPAPGSTYGKFAFLRNLQTTRICHNRIELLCVRWLQHFVLLNYQPKIFTKALVMICYKNLYPVLRIHC